MKKGQQEKAKASRNLQRADCSPSLFDIKFPLSTLARNFVKRLNNRGHAEPCRMDGVSRIVSKRRDWIDPCLGPCRGVVDYPRPKKYMKHILRSLL